jgi:hypothetical protein
MWVHKVERVFLAIISRHSSAMLFPVKIKVFHPGRKQYAWRSV